MGLIQIATAVGSTRAVTFSLMDRDGQEVNLTDLGATKVTVQVCDGVQDETIDSDSDAVTFSGSRVTVQFGQLALRPRPGAYFPKISYSTPSSANEVITGRGFLTEIKLTVNC